MLAPYIVGGNITWRLRPRVIALLTSSKSNSSFVKARTRRGTVGPIQTDWMAWENGQAYERYEDADRVNNVDMHCPTENVLSRILNQAIIEEEQ